MTSIVGIRCKDGVVVGADSSTTFVDGGQKGTIEQPTEHKIRIIGEQVIVAGTGYVGHGQRFCSVVKRLWDTDQFRGKSELEIAKMLSSEGIKDFAQTHMNSIQYSAFVAYPSGNQPCLCELPGGAMAFQPEIKMEQDLWFVSGGSGQAITDTLLALFREIFWRDNAPSIEGGVLTALWALQHACEVNTGGIKEPIRLAVLRWQKNKLRARMLEEHEVLEHKNMLTSATDYMRGFRDVLEGKVEASEVPRPSQP